MNTYIEVVCDKKRNDKAILDALAEDECWDVDGVSNSESKALERLKIKGLVKVGASHNRPVWEIAKWKCTLDGHHWTTSDYKKCRYCLPALEV